MIYAEPENARGRSFHGLLAYALHETAEAATMKRVALAVAVNTVAATATMAVDEMEAIARAALVGRRRGQRPDRMAFHFILSWHPDDRPTPKHMTETAVDALRTLGIGEHQAVIVGHTDTAKPHVHVIASTIHPETLKAAKLGWRYRTMSRWARRYEEDHRAIRCPKRNQMRAKGETRKRQRRSEYEAAQSGRMLAGRGHGADRTRVKHWRLRPCG